MKGTRKMPSDQRAWISAEVVQTLIRLGHATQDRESRVVYVKDSLARALNSHDRERQAIRRAILDPPPVSGIDR